MLDGTPALRLYAAARRARLARQKAATVQERTLAGLVRRAAATRFGRAHGFGAIRDVAGFRARVPLTRYEDFWRTWLEPAFPVLDGVAWPGPIPWLAVSSGTSSGTTKWIPVSPAMMRSNRRAALDVLAWHLAARPGSRVFAGPSLVLGGSTNLVERAPGVRSGDLSGIAAATVPRWARSRYFPPPDLALEADWDRKVERLARETPAGVRSISGTPSWLLVLFERLAALHPSRPARLASWFPDLELVVHGGVGFQPYRTRFDALLAGSRAETREVYPASEGFVAVADRGPGEGMRLLLDTGLFLEFVPVEELEAASPARHWVADAEAGQDYALALSTNAGLWAYLLGDTVRLVSRDPPRIVVTGRTSTMLSAFGEHLIGEELDGAVAEAAAAIGSNASDFSVGAVHVEGRGAPGHHLFVIELDPAVAPGELPRLAAVLDAALTRRNEDYAAHRAGDAGMGPPRVLTVPRGFFAAWMRGRGRLGGQNKVPRVVAGETLEGLAAAARSAVAEAIGGG